MSCSKFESFSSPISDSPWLEQSSEMGGMGDISISSSLFYTDLSLFRLIFIINNVSDRLYYLLLFFFFLLSFGHFKTFKSLNLFFLILKLFLKFMFIIVFICICFLVGLVVVVVVKKINLSIINPRDLFIYFK